MKKLLALLIVVVLALSAVALVACDNGTGKTKIAVMTPNPTHDWAGSIGTFAKEKVAEINAEGKYEATQIPCVDSTQQISQIEDITSNKNYDAVVILPMDNQVQAALEALVATGIEVIQFDRLISTIEDDVVSSVMGDNEGIGYETGKRFLDNGLTKEDQVLLLCGDLSSVPEMRTAGFKKALTEAGWTEAEINACIKDLGSTGWSRTEGERLFTDWLSGANDAEIAKTKFVFTHDDPIAMGIFDALASSALDAAKKAAFLGEDRVTLASSAGAAENYALLAGEHTNATFTETYNNLKDYFSVTYSPIMINDAIDFMIDHLDGKTVETKIVLPSKVVDSTNVGDFTGFGEF